jgi:hypothetical protein
MIGNLFHKKLMKAAGMAAFIVFCGLGSLEILTDLVFFLIKSSSLFLGIV